MRWSASERSEKSQDKKGSLMRANWVKAVWWVGLPREGLWERKRLYFRRRGAHLEWASPIMRMASRGRGEMWRDAAAGSVSSDRAVVGEVYFE